MQMFRKAHVNITLLDVIKQVPRYAKFLKDLCISKNKLKGNETVKFDEDISAVLQTLECKDPDVFIVPCKLWNLHVPRAMLDLGVSINVLPYSVYKSIDIRDDDSPNSSSILLGRPFLKIAKTKIDVYNGTLSMEFDGEVININIFEDKRKFDKNSVKEVAGKFKLDDELLGIVEFMNDRKNIGFNEMGILRKVKFQELEEFQNKTFENSYIYKNKTKAFHEKYLSCKSFETSQKLRSRWVGSFIVTNVFDHGAAEIKSNKTGKVLKVSGHKLKVFYEGLQEKDMEVDSLERQDYIE
uniref:Uncharacterized protein n=1 Tax=Lactuca sativa TaxID=4236 RepID=A0A9R1UEC6_LACSA|nr:hypothetical protein LSAT_V11C900456490 [Lactuca sativa]